MPQISKEGCRDLVSFSFFVALVLALAALVFIVPPRDETSPEETAPDATAIPTSGSEQRSEAPTTPEPGSVLVPGQAQGESDSLFAIPIVDWSADQWVDLGISLLIFLIIAIFGGRFVVWLGRRIARRTKTGLDDELFAAARAPIKWIVAILGFQVAYTRLAFLNPSWKQAFDTVSFILYVIAVSVVVWITIDYGLTFYREAARKKDADLRSIDRLLPLVRTFAKGLLVVVSFFIILNHFGIDITAAVAALGLTGFALSLAAKDTLTNMISGVILAVDRPFRIGDRIYNDEIGGWVDVVEIGLRSTQVHTRDNRMVIIPNAQLADNSVINYNYPNRNFRLQVDIGVIYGTEIETTRQVLHDAVRPVEGVMPDKPVQVLFVGFGDSAMVFRVRWWIADYADMRKMNDRVYQAIQEALDTNGIVSPGPTLDVNYHLNQTNADRLARALRAEPDGTPPLRPDASGT